MLERLVHLFRGYTIGRSHISNMRPDDAGRQNDRFGFAKVSELLRHHESVRDDEDQDTVQTTLSSGQTEICRFFSGGYLRQKQQ